MIRIIHNNKETKSKNNPNEFARYDHFTKPLMFRTLNEVSKYLTHFPFSYDDPPSDDKEWNVINIISYRDIAILKKIIHKCISVCSFKIMHPPKMLKNVIASLKNAKNSIPTLYFVKMFNEMDALIAIKPMKKIGIRIIISMSDRDLYAYYKYIFVLANIFSIKF